jgi:hypothetical protein
MVNRWKGNFVVAAATTSSGTDYTGKANGAWGLNSQLQQKQGGLWAKGIGVPSAPTIGTAIKDNASAIVSFTPPSDTGGQPITSYTVTSSPSNITATGSSSPITITGLTNGTAYTFTVTATNSVGTSLPSAASNSVTPSIQPTIGQAYGGGFYAGQINDSGTIYNLVVAPKATGNVGNTTWGPSGVTTGFTSTINGPVNSAGLAALGATYPAATFCENLTIGGYSDWYLPARDELEVCYYFLKPTADNNDIRSGSNAYAIAPEPISTNHTPTSPAQTIAGIGFRDGETNAFTISPQHYYRTSTELDSTNDMLLSFLTGFVNSYGKTWNGGSVRAIRRIYNSPFVQQEPNAPTITSVTVNNITATINFTAPSFDGNAIIISYTATSSFGETGSVTQRGSGSINVNIQAFRDTTFTVVATNLIGNSAPSNTSASISGGPLIGQSYGGGFYAGKISTTANGIATHALIVAPRATGFASKKWGPTGVTTGIVSQINGPANSASLAALGSSYEGATFCEGLTIGGYTDWYLPAKLEVEVIWWYLRTGVENSPAPYDGVTGKNPYAVAPEPIDTAYVWSTSYPQSWINTSPTIFKSGGIEAYNDDFTLTSTEANSNSYEAVYMYTVWWHNDNKFTHARPTRAVRRIAI